MFGACKLIFSSKGVHFAIKVMLFLFSFTFPGFELIFVQMGHQVSFLYA